MHFLKISSVDAIRFHLIHAFQAAFLGVTGKFSRKRREIHASTINALTRSDSPVLVCTLIALRTTENSVLACSDHRGWVLGLHEAIGPWPRAENDLRTRARVAELADALDSGSSE